MGNESSGGMKKSGSSGSITCPPEMKDIYSEIPLDPEIVTPWENIDTKLKELHDSTVRETQKRYETLNAQRTHNENSLFEKSKELALKHKEKTSDLEILRREFDLFWEKCVKEIMRDTPPIRDIDIMTDVKILLSDIYESAPVDLWMESGSELFSTSSYSDYVVFKKNTEGGSGVAVKDRTAECTQTLSSEDEVKIRLLVKEVVQQTDEMIQSFNISKMGYNKSCSHVLTHYIETRVTEHEERAKKYVLKKQFFMDLIISICRRANKTITDQHRLFRETNDPLLYLKKKREEYYSIFQKYCHGSTSAVIFGEILCQKLKEPIEQSVYKKTSRDLTGEMRSNCDSLNGNRSNLEKHILKTLAEEEDFDKYMNYIHNPRDHFKSFIRDEVSRYIRDKFSVSVLPKMKENIELLQKKILTAAHESTEHVQLNSGDVHLWLKSFTQKLSDELIFSEKHLSGVTHDGVEDFNLLKDVIGEELTTVTSDIRERFSRDTFPVKLDHKFRPDELLIDHLCRCCWVLCPFCRAICTNTIENHDGDHSVLFHRCISLEGWYQEGTRHMSINICTSAVASGDCFKPNATDDIVPWRDYRRAGGVYAKWSITPDVSKLPYWKWVVCRFQKDLEKYYNTTFEGRGQIPDEWRSYSKQETIRSLDGYFYE